MDVVDVIRSADYEHYAAIGHTEFRYSILTRMWTIVAMRKYREQTSSIGYNIYAIIDLHLVANNRSATNERGRRQRRRPSRMQNTGGIRGSVGNLLKLFMAIVDVWMYLCVRVSVCVCGSTARHQTPGTEPNSISWCWLPSLPLPVMPPLKPFPVDHCHVATEIIVASFSRLYFVHMACVCVFRT